MGFSFHFRPAWSLRLGCAAIGLAQSAAAFEITDNVGGAPSNAVVQRPAVPVDDRKPRLRIEFEGAVYDGEVDARGTPDGYGVMTYAGGESYAGDWVKGARRGAGSHRFSDGRAFRCLWKDNKPDGKGSLVLPDGTRMVDLDFEDVLRDAAGEASLALDPPGSGPCRPTVRIVRGRGTEKVFLLAGEGRPTELAMPATLDALRWGDRLSYLIQTPYGSRKAGELALDPPRGAVSLVGIEGLDFKAARDRSKAWEPFLSPALQTQVRDFILEKFAKPK